MKRARLAALVVLLTPVPSNSATVLAQAPRLGTIDFPTSGSPEARELFLRGVLFLHSFEYSSAAAAFREAQKLDRGFAMAYWGEAMTYNHPIWNQRDRESALAALARLAPTREARQAKASTQREKAYLDAVEILYLEGAKPERDTAYALAMAELAADYPDDPEAQAFYALSLLGLSQGVRVIPTYMRAAAIAEELFDRNPNHPGAVHYLIHSYDDPIHAPLGLRAARAYSKIAPDAAHAQHMTTHIFLALGMWDDVVSQNRIAAELTGWGPGHYTAWLGYGLAQQGRSSAALDHLRRAHANLQEGARAGPRSYLAGMRAHYIISTERWDDPALNWTLDLAGTGPVAEAQDAFVQGYAALQRGDRASARSQLARLRALAPEPAPSPSGRTSSVPLILRKELEAVLRLAAGVPQRAAELMREATVLEDAMPLEFGPPDVVKPSHELLGEILLQLGRYGEAQREFERALALAPKRALSLLGLGRAAAAAGDGKAAARAYSTLQEIWHSADADLPGLLEAQSFTASPR